MPSIVAVNRFCESSGKAFQSYIDYIDRNSATKKANINKYNLFDDYLDYMSDEDKTVSLSYKQGTNDISNIFTDNSNALSEDEKKSLKKNFIDAQENGSNMWQTVISFENEFLEKQGLYSERERYLDEPRLQAAARKAIKNMLVNEKLDNATWAASFHYNTDNIHIHIAIVEPVPEREMHYYRQWEKDSEGKIIRRYNPDTGKKERIPIMDGYGNQIKELKYKGTFKNKSLQLLKSTMVNELDLDKSQVKELTGLMRDVVTAKKERQLLKDDHFRKQLAGIYMDLVESGVERKNWNYNQNLIRDIKPKIDDLSGLYIAKYHSDDFIKITSKIKDLEAKHKELYGGEQDLFNKRVHTDKDSLYARLGNAILKELKEYDRDFGSVDNGYTGVVYKTETIARPSKSDLIKQTSHNDFRSAAYYLKRSMYYQYEKWRNMREFEKLEREIERRNNGYEYEGAETDL